MSDVIDCTVDITSVSPWLVGRSRKLPTGRSLPVLDPVPVGSGTGCIPLLNRMSATPLDFRLFLKTGLYISAGPSRGKGTIHVHVATS